MAVFSLGISETAASVVQQFTAAAEAAFCKAVRVTLTGSIIPALSISGTMASEPAS